MAPVTVVRPVHIPVMLDEVVAALRPALDRPNAVVVDATVGMGGHAAALLDAFPDARLIGIDRDGDALAVAGERLAQFGDRAVLVRARFDALPSVLDELGIARVQAVLFDLGMSSLQIDETERGFSYAKDAPLDMRMDDRLDVSAADIVNTWTAVELARVFSSYGEEPHALRVAQAVVAARSEQPIATTGRLVDVVTAAMPAAVRFGSGGHPAKRVFQALRIAVNDELGALADALPAALSRVAVGGRVAVLSYHSLEDRLVKHAFKQASESQAPRHLPVVPESMMPAFRVVDSSVPGQPEVEANPRSASARLRVVTRIKED